MPAAPQTSGRQRIRVGGASDGGALKSAGAVETFAASSYSPTSTTSAPYTPPVYTSSANSNLPRFHSALPAEAHPPAYAPAPLPRTWTASKQQVQRMTAQEALQRELQELDDGDADAKAIISHSTPSSALYGKPPSRGTMSSGGGWTNASSVANSNAAPAPRVSEGNTYNKAYYNNTFAPQPPPGPRGDARPASVAVNNLMGGDTGSARGSSAGAPPTSSPKIVAKLKEKLGSVGSANNSTTAVQAFHVNDVEEPAVARSAPEAQVVAQRKGSPAAAATRPGTGVQKTVAAWESELKQLISNGSCEEALNRPGPKEGTVKCYVKRIKSLFGTHPKYEVYMENGDTFLMASRRRKKSKTSSYLLATSKEDDITRDADSCASKLKANYVGTEYLLWGKGGSHANKKGFGDQLLAVDFKPTVNMVKGGPRTMSAVVPAPDQAGRSGHPLEGTLSECLEKAKARELSPASERQLEMLHTQKPFYDEVKGTHFLDFKGRVTKSSLKNFQLVRWNHNTNTLGSELVMQFGKKGKEEFAMDFAYPLSIHQAFSLALASIDTKLCYAL